MPKKLKTEKSSRLQNRTASDEEDEFQTLASKIEGPKSSNDMSQAESDCDIDASEPKKIIVGMIKTHSKKRYPSVGLNFSKVPILPEIPKTNNPAALVSSKTQKDTKQIKN